MVKVAIRLATHEDTSATPNQLCALPSGSAPRWPGGRAGRPRRGRRRRPGLGAGLTQLQVGGERLGKPQSFVSKYEASERRLDLVERRQVCAALGIGVTPTSCAGSRSVSSCWGAPHRTRPTGSNRLATGRATTSSPSVGSCCSAAARLICSAIVDCSSLASRSSRRRHFSPGWPQTQLC